MNNAILSTTIKANYPLYYIKDMGDSSGFWKSMMLAFIHHFRARLYLMHFLVIAQVFRTDKVAPSISFLQNKFILRTRSKTNRLSNRRVTNCAISIFFLQYCNRNLELKQQTKSNHPFLSPSRKGEK